MRKFNFKKVLFGLSVSLVLAMAIGSFALSETQTAATPKAAEPTSVVAGAFTITGEDVTVDQDYTFTGTTETDGVLTIISNKEMTIKNTSSSSTTDRIVIDLPDGVDEANIILDGVNVSSGRDVAFKIADNAEFDVNITLADNSKNYLISGRQAGLMKGDDKTDEADIAKLGTLRIGVPTEAGSKGNGILEATAGENAAGIGGGDNGNASNIEIAGGEITAIGNTGAGIGGGYGGNGNNIKITGGKVTAKGGTKGAGIGGSGRKASAGDGNNIEISGGEVKAYGGFFAAGIGGGGIDSDMGTAGDGNKIKITGGVVEAYGGKDNNYGGVPAGIGGGAHGSGSSNTISGDAVVMATSGKSGTAALQGFDGASGGSIDKGVTFTGYSSNFDDDGRATDFVWDASGNMYDNVEISGNATFPASLTITTGSKLTVGSEANITLASGANLTVADDAELVNDGTIPDDGTVVCDGTGKVTTKMNFYRADGSKYDTDKKYQTYKTGGEVQKYDGLPNPDDTTLLENSLNSDKFIYWYYLNGSTEVKIDNSKDVEPNQHKFYEKREEAYSISTSKQGEGSITPNVSEAYKGDEVTFTVTPAEGYELKEGSLSVKAEDEDIEFTEDGGKYTFTMPDSAVTISAVFEQIPEPTPTPPGPEPQPTPPGPQPGPEPTPTPEPTPEPSVNPDGDGSGSGASSKTSDPFIGGVALALLGVATTGAVLVRKHK